MSSSLLIDSTVRSYHLTFYSCFCLKSAHKSEDGLATRSCEPPELGVGRARGRRGPQGGAPQPGFWATDLQVGGAELDCGQGPGRCGESHTAVPTRICSCPRALQDGWGPKESRDWLATV